MLGTVTTKFRDLFSKLGGQKRLTENNISEAIQEVRLALLEADVNYGVTKTLVKRLKEKALGEKVLQSVTAGQQFIKIVYDELVILMGGEEEALDLSGHPTIFMVCGLQGAGKTTQCAKLARYMKKQGKVKTPLLVACDLQRPAAVEQLRVLGEQINVPVFSMPIQDPLEVAQQAMRVAREQGHDLVIVDTAGRLHIDEALMAQLEALKQLLNPQEVLLVANATTGQDAVTIASTFNQRIGVTGTILTMLDGNSRGGAAISIREVTGRPLKFEGIGERMEDLQVFNPRSMADRILGMGDTINLVKRAQEHFSEGEARQLEQKLRSARFTYDDFLKQLQSVKKMGPLKSLLAMLPGMAQSPLSGIDEKEFVKIEAIICSMTLKEREGKDELTHGRRKRIAEGSGTTQEEVNRLVKLFKQALQFFKNMPNMKQLEKMMGGSLWR